MFNVKGLLRKMFIPLTDKISLVEGPNKAQYPYCNCFFINDDIKALIDNCCSREDLDFLVSQHLDVVINSHFHEDHILNNPRFPDAQIWAHRLDAMAISSLDVFREYYGLTEGAEHRKMADEFIKAANLQASPVHYEFEDGEILDFGTVRLLVVWATGHTPGHCCFYEEKNGILFSSDFDLSRFGPWYGHSCSNLDDIISSVHKCMALEPEIVVTSHSRIIKEDIPARFKKYLEILFRKEEQVRNSLVTPSTLEELAQKQIFYEGQIPAIDPFYHWSEKMAIQQHLDRLLRMNEIQQEGDLYFLR